MLGGGDKIKIEKELLAKVKKFSVIAGYSSPEEFVHHVLDREIAKFEQDGQDEDEIKIEIVVSSQEYADLAVKAISEAGRTGKIGDGKIFVSDINSVLRIRTGEEDIDAL